MLKIIEGEMYAALGGHHRKLLKLLNANSREELRTYGMFYSESALLHNRNWKKLTEVNLTNEARVACRTESRDNFEAEEKNVNLSCQN